MLSAGAATVRAAAARWVRPLRPRDAAALGIAATLVRLVWVAFTARPPAETLRDPAMYRYFAEQIASGAGYVSLGGEPTSYFPPGFPLSLGALQWLSDLVGLGGHLHWTAGVVQSFGGGVTAVLVGVAGARWFGPRVGLLAGGVMAFWPNVISYTSTLLSEPLYLLVFAAFLVAIAPRPDQAEPADAGPEPADAAGSWPQARRRWVPLLRAGVLLGAAVLIRPQVVLVVPALAVAEVVSGRWRGAVRTMAALAVGASVVVAPWFVRNLVVLDHPVLVSTNGGDNLCVGFHDGAPGHFVIPKACDTGEFYVDGREAEIRRNAETSARARRWAMGHIGELPALSVRKLWHTYRADTDGLRAVESYEANRFLPDGVRTAWAVLSNAAYAVIMAFAAGGAGVLLWRLRRSGLGHPDSRSGLQVLLLSASALVVPVLVFGDGRFKVPAAPLLAVLCGVGMAALWGRVHERR